MESKKTTCIYALQDNFGIRYIGKADNPDTRFKSHISEAFNENGKCYDLPKSRWLRKRKNEISLVVLETVAMDKWAEREVYWINYYKEKCDLLNLAEGGCGGSGKKSNDTKILLRNKSIGRRHSDATKEKHKRHYLEGSIYDISQHSHEGHLNINAKKILQLGMDGCVIKEWGCIKYAHEYYKNENRYNLTLCLKGFIDSWAGFKWSYVNQPKKESVAPSLKRGVYKPITISQFDREMNLIRSFDSIREAGRITGINYSHIREAVCDDRRSAGGYIWRESKHTTKYRKYEDNL